jgi:RNA polymerase sigma factor (sigma-70 family)
MEVSAVDDPEVGTPRFEDCFPELLRLALASARRILGTGAMTEDVAAEALARMWLRWGRLAQLDHRDAWLVRVTTNLALDNLRRRTPVVAGAVAPDAADSVLARDSVARALAGLPRRQREVLVLRHICDLSVLDTANALGISVNTIKRHQQRGLATIRASLGPDMQAEELRDAF